MREHPNYTENNHTRTEIDIEKIRLFSNEEEFSALSIELYREVTNLIITVSSIKRKVNGKIMPLNREEGALIGNLVRYSKISAAFLEQYVRGRTEICMILVRSLMETYINLKYFLKFKDQYTISHYIKHSLKQEKILLDFIKENGGKKPELKPIEDRMTKSLRESIKASGYTEEEIKNSSKWNDKVKNRLSEIASPSFYILYGNSSQSVHGNWQDILFYHLTEYEDGFIQNQEWRKPTIQLLASQTLFSCDLIREYAEEVLPDSENKTKLIELIIDIFGRTYTLDRLHELYMQEQTK